MSTTELLAQYEEVKKCFNNSYNYQNAPVIAPDFFMDVLILKNLAEQRNDATTVSCIQKDMKDNHFNFFYGMLAVKEKNEIEKRAAEIAQQNPNGYACDNLANALSGFNLAYKA